MTARKLKQIFDSAGRSNVLQKRQLYVVKELTKKIATENAIITQADKWNTIVIIYSKEYSEKVNLSLRLITLIPWPKIHAKNLKKLIYKTLQESNLIIDKRQIKYLTQMKAAPPKLKAQLKLHKIGFPIRPVINNRTAPAYKLAKHLTRILTATPSPTPSISQTI